MIYEKAREEVVSPSELVRERMREIIKEGRWDAISQIFEIEEEVEGRHYCIGVIEKGLSLLPNNPHNTFRREAQLAYEKAQEDMLKEGWHKVIPPEKGER